MANADDNRLARMEEGLLAQDACNPSGVAHALIRQMGQIRRDYGGEFSTDMLGRDPGVILLVAKLADLCRIDVNWEDGPVREAYREARAYKEGEIKGLRKMFRCTRLKPYYGINCSGEDDPRSRQGYYITAANHDEALAKMAEDHPNDALWGEGAGLDPFTCELWKE